MYPAKDEENNSSPLHPRSVLPAVDSVEWRLMLCSKGYPGRDYTLEDHVPWQADLINLHPGQVVGYASTHVPYGIQGHGSHVGQTAYSSMWIVSYHRPHDAESVLGVEVGAGVIQGSANAHIPQAGSPLAPPNYSNQGHGIAPGNQTHVDYGQGIVAGDGYYGANGT